MRPRAKLEALVRHLGGTEAAWTTSAKIGTAAAAAAVVILTSRSLPAAERGELAAGIAGTVLLGSGLSLSLWLGTSIELRHESGIGHAARRFAIFYPLGLTLLMVPASIVVFGGFDDSIWPWAVLASIPLTSYTLLQGLPVGSGDLRSYAIGELIRGWFGAVVCIALAGLTGDPAVAILGWGSGGLLGTAYLLGRSPAISERQSMASYLRLVGPQSVRAHPGNLLTHLTVRLDLVLLAGLSSSQEVAYYSLAIGVAEVLWVISAAQGVTHLAQQVQSADLAAARRLAIAAVRRVLKLVLPPALVLGVLAGPLVVGLAGEDYSESATPLRLALLAAAIYSVVQVLGPYVAAGLRRPGAITVNGAAASIINVGLLVALAPSHGAVGAAIASVAAYAFSAGMYLTMLWRLTPGPVGSELVSKADAEVGAR